MNNPVETLIALMVLVAIYFVITVTHAYLPARMVKGYVVNPETSEPYIYRINGMLILFVSVLLWWLAGYMNVLPWSWLYEHRWECALSACVIGLAYSFWVVVPAPSTGKPFVKDFFLGRIENIQHFGHFDAKMWLYLVGAVMLVLNALSAALYHVQVFGDAMNPGILLHAALLCFFVLDYFLFERVHLYTYDLFAERVGFKLGWGCLCFYPFFYPIGLWSSAGIETPALMENYGGLWMIGSALIFFMGWSLARGANMQKYLFKTRPDAKFLGFIEPETVSDGEKTLLCSGFWRVARHVNYLGELLMATGLVLALGQPGNIWPWLYPLYYVLLFIPRERDDDARCAEKYGPLWDRYKERVPNRIIPGVY